MSAKLCEICNIHEAMYVCRRCGRSVCGMCFELPSWLCLDCLRQTRREEVTPKEVWSTPSRFFMLGFVMIVIGVSLIMVASIYSKGLGVSGGAVFFIGPIPIILGYGPYSIWIIMFAVILTILAIAFFIILRSGFPRAKLLAPRSS